MSDLTNLSGDPQAGRQEEAQRLVERGNELLLRHVRPADAAGAYSQALQLAPELVSAHLGMAQANFALGQRDVARMAAEYVTRLAPGTRDAEIAQALMLTLDRKFQPALDLVEGIGRDDPGYSYAHALRGYILRCMRRDYEAALAEAKASRLMGSVDLRPLFPPVDLMAPASTPLNDFSPAGGAPLPRPVPPPSAQNPIRRTQVRAGFAMRGYPVATYTLIGLCVLVFFLQNIDPGVTDAGVLVSDYVQQGDWWRLLTSMFLHESILHLLFNMLSLFFIGPFIEQIYGVRRFLAIYFVSGIVGGLVFMAVQPHVGAVGASGAIFGIFGAMGAFFFAFRNQLGRAANGLIGQWFFWLALNLFLGISDPNIALSDHIGGLIAGAIMALVLAPRGR